MAAPIRSMSAMRIQNHILPNRTILKSISPRKHSLNERIGFANLSCQVINESKTNVTRRTTTSFDRRCFLKPVSFVFPYTYRPFSSERKCWKCGRPTAKWELFFCDCGMVQAPAAEMNYFSLFALDIDFDIDTTQLSKTYKDLQKNLHPDKFSQKSKEEKKFADAQSSLVNKAYFTLLKPLSRGLYMLDHYGYPIEESSGDVDPEFLLEILELNEQLDEAPSNEDIKIIEDEIASLIKEIVTDISKAFKVQELETAKKLIVKYQYYGNIDDKIREYYRKNM